jgi:Tol biopolymer transport system component
LDPETLEYRILVDNDLLNEGLSVSPDGNSLFFSASHLFRKKDPPIPTTQLILYDLTQNKMRKLSSIGFGLSWSPDSKKILYNSILPLPPKLFIKEMNTKRTYIIKNIEVVASGADWSPDGRKIVLAIPQEEAVKLVVFRPP